MQHKNIIVCYINNIFSSSFFFFDMAGSLEGAGAHVSIEEGHYLSNLDHLKKFSVVEPFSLAYGGGGGGFGGEGGVGFNGSNPTGYETRKGQSYGIAAMNDLYGGSGGQMGYVSPQDVAVFTTPTSRGGAGGGAIEVSVLPLIFSFFSLFLFGLFIYVFVCVFGVFVVLIDCSSE